MAYHLETLSKLRVVAPGVGRVVGLVCYLLLPLERLVWSQMESQAKQITRFLVMWALLAGGCKLAIHGHIGTSCCR